MMKKLLLTLVFMFAGTAMAQQYDFSAVASSGQTLYYKIIDAATNPKTVSIVSENGSFPYYNNNTEPTGTLIIPTTVSYNENMYLVTSIGWYAFSGCRGLSGSLSIPASVTSIGDGAFRGCSGLSGSLSIPNSVKSIGDRAFSDCRGFDGSLRISDQVTNIGEYAFFECGVTGSLTIPHLVTSIGINAFEGCSSLTSIEIPNSVTSIGSRAFSGCSNLRSIVIPCSITTIEYETFYRCSNLSSVLIPRSVTTIGRAAFAGCSNLTSVSVEWDEPLPINTYVFRNMNLMNISLTVPHGKEADYGIAPVWKDFKKPYLASPYVRTEVSKNPPITGTVSKRNEATAYENDDNKVSENDPTLYTVTAEKLNVRTKADKNSPVIGTVNKGDKVTVSDIKGTWGKIAFNDDYGWISTKYLTFPIYSDTSTGIHAQIQRQIQVWSNSAAAFVEKYELPTPSFMTRERFLITIVILSILLFFLCKNSESKSGVRFTLRYTVFIIIALLELSYLMAMRSNPIWFCNPIEVGWLMIFINFFLFAGVTSNQSWCFLGLMEDYKKIYVPNVDLQTGYYSWIMTIVVAGIVGIFWNDYLIYVGIVFLLAQLVQLLLIIVACIKEGRFLCAIPFVCLYIVGLLATYIILISFILLLVLVAICAVVVGALFTTLFGDGNPDIITTPDGKKLRHCYGENYKDDYGNNWIYDSGTNTVRRE